MIFNMYVPLFLLLPNVLHHLKKNIVKKTTNSKKKKKTKTRKI